MALAAWRSHSLDPLRQLHSTVLTSEDSESQLDERVLVDGAAPAIELRPHRHERVVAGGEEGERDRVHAEVEQDSSAPGGLEEVAPLRGRLQRSHAQVGERTESSDQLHRPADDRGEGQVLRVHDGPARAIGGIDDGVGLGQRGRQGLLDQHHGAGLESLHGIEGVARRGSGDHHRVRSRRKVLVAHRPRPERRRTFLGALGRPRCDRNDRDRGERGGHPVHHADHAGPAQRDGSFLGAHRVTLGADTGAGSAPDNLSMVRKVLMFVVTVVATGALLAGAVVIAGPQIVAIASAGSGDPQPLDLDAFDSYSVRSQVFASDGSLLATLHGDENREPIALDQVPEPVVQSILAVEDAEFYQHRGINARALARALVENVSAGGVEQGGSTITQQLVKNALLTNERSLERKTREAVLALRLEEEMTKDEILETYLNTVYFGSGAYGVQAAAETYWGRNVQDLSWAEGAMLAALISNPVAYDPTLYPEEATAQRAIAVDRLVSLGILTREDADFIAYFPVPT